MAARDAAVLRTQIAVSGDRRARPATSSSAGAWIAHRFTGAGAGGRSNRCRGERRSGRRPGRDADRSVAVLRAPRYGFSAQHAGGRTPRGGSGSRDPVICDNGRGLAAMLALAEADRRRVDPNARARGFRRDDGRGKGIGRSRRRQGVLRRRPRPRSPRRSRSTAPAMSASCTAARDRAAFGSPSEGTGGHQLSGGLRRSQSGPRRGRRGEARWPPSSCHASPVRPSPSGASGAGSPLGTRSRRRAGSRWISARHPADLLERHDRADPRGGAPRGPPSRTGGARPARRR